MICKLKFCISFLIFLISCQNSDLLIGRWWYCQNGDYVELYIEDKELSICNGTSMPALLHFDYEIFSDTIRIFNTHYENKFDNLYNFSLNKDTLELIKIDSMAGDTDSLMVLRKATGPLVYYFSKRKFIYNHHMFHLKQFSKRAKRNNCPVYFMPENKE